MVDVQTVGVLVTAASVSVAAIYYILSLHNQNQTRQAQLFMQLYSQISTNKEFFKHVMDQMILWEYKDFDDFEKKWGIKADPDENTYWHLHVNFIEGISILVNRGLVSVGLVESWMGFWIIGNWEKFAPYIREFRVKYNDPRLFIENEMCYKRVKEYRLKHFS